MFSSFHPTNSKELLEEQVKLGARLIRTIPRGSSIDDCKGFITVLSSESEPPVLTFCVQKAGSIDKSVVMTLVFNNPDDYSSFVDGLLVDLHMNFNVSKVDIDN